MKPLYELMKRIIKKELTKEDWDFIYTNYPPKFQANTYVYINPIKGVNFYSEPTEFQLITQIAPEVSVDAKTIEWAYDLSNLHDNYLGYPNDNQVNMTLVDKPLKELRAIHLKHLNKDSSYRDIGHRCARPIYKFHHDINYTTKELCSDTQEDLNQYLLNPDIDIHSKLQKMNKSSSINKLNIYKAFVDAPSTTRKEQELLITPLAIEIHKTKTYISLQKAVQESYKYICSNPQRASTVLLLNYKEFLKKIHITENHTNFLKEIEEINKELLTREEPLAIVGSYF